MRRHRRPPRERRQRDGRLTDAVYRAAFEASPLPICLFDFDGNYVKVNPAFCALVGADEEEIIGAHVSRFNHPDEDEDSAANVRRLRSGATGNHRIERRLLATDGRIIHVNSEVTVLHHDGEPVGILSMVYDVSDRVATETQLRRQALHDPLTGLANRHHLEETLQALTPSGAPLAMCFADLDGFKCLNDRFGHGTADEVLASIGDRLRSVLVPSDVALRLGGDEFLVIRRGVDDEGAARCFGEDVLGAIRQDVGEGHERATVSASVGVAFGSVDAELLLQRADHVMYEAKRSGRDRVQVERVLTPQG